MPYYNAGFINTNDSYSGDDNDQYSNLRMEVKNMKTNECFGSNKLNISFDRSVVHVPFNVYAKGKNVTQGTDTNFRQFD